jgi:predicted dehydrogenase
MSFKIGIVGCGSIGNVHARNAAAAGLEVAGTWDVLTDRSGTLAELHDGCTSHASLDDLLASDIDAVAVAVPNNVHKECAVASLEAGKHVLLEKPMAMSVAECDEIIAARDRAGRILQMGFVCRGLPTAFAAKQFLDAGRFGEIYHVKCSMYRRRGIPGLGGWFTTKALSGGGPLIDLGVHALDLAMHLTGNHEPVRASGQVVSKFGSPIEDYRYTNMWSGPPKLDGVFDVEDGAVGLVRFENGMTLEVNVTWAANLPEDVLPSGVTILGTKAGCFFELFGKKVQIATEEEGLITDVSPHFETGDSHDVAWGRQYRQFIAAVQDGVPPHATAEDGRCVQALIDSIYASSEAGREVEVD